MRLEDYLDFLERDVIRLKGHRIGLEDIVDAHNEGEAPEQIVGHYLAVSLEQVYGAITYYLHNRAEVDAYVGRVNAIKMERLRMYHPSPVIERLARLKLERQASQSVGDEDSISS
ncbi:MAG TPA: DUF433 domain-containing protein [Ktedonobacterales bacterium]|nr:DUF433 domain-containing protein [Ktedonobacterales bacterium]